MSSTNTVVALAAAAMLLLAGCIGGVPGGADGGTDGTATTDDGAGTVTLYVSDQPGAMGDFEHLNVTIDRVAYHRVNASDDGDVEAETDANTTETEANETDAEADPEDEAEAEAEGENDPDREDDQREGWETYDINDTTVDLTELQGENATVVGQQRLPNGTYDKVFLYVSEVDGTLDDGSSTKVKLPSGKLQLEKRFTVGNNESMDFVFDATVVKAGKSGKYILTPVVSESGTDVPIKEVGRDEESGLSARFAGSVERGEAATVTVTQRGEPVSGATVEIGDREYTTAGDGTVMFDVPADAEEVEVEVEYEDGEVELKRKFAERDADEDEAEAERDADDTERDAEEEEEEPEEREEDEDEDEAEEREDDDATDDAGSDAGEQATATES
ncbi:DUF4382 domain-containing protein [Haloglomus halophilum]|uniref:DUF4382 domain-containing protein n=1 Tax=Haloglomus halophilum TaxID=2962672 RepID=UPI0020C999FE|nr:DUF4382 domain-containing protein [Haloglomus halophilum]